MTKKLKVLIAEDEDSNFLYIEELLISMDLKLIHAKDGKETVEICKSNSTIDLILMDIQLLKISGIDLTCELKADPETTNIPVIVLTALTRPEQIEKIMNESNCDGYIGKPFEEKDLMNIIEIYLNKKK